MQIENSTICTNKKNQVGIVVEINSGVGQFFAFDADGNTAEGVATPLEELTIAPLSKFPASRRSVLADEQWSDIGYALTDSPATPPPVPKQAD